ncbi:MAG TPA: sulfatase-like hydrolase/transferase [Candidatus Merdivicinus intestinigallinarum]|nr:sulfatase-like hydrolase/transferase [Candidatus Merdivicinus intestinigallinarum]
MADNILLITTDQQRFDTIQALGNRSIFTPHLNYIASQGMAFTRCYADCPICVPSRTTIMTGQRGFESGVISNATHAQAMSAATKERRTLPAILTDAGYQTCAMGKMHFDPPRAHYGFEEMRLPLDYMRQYDKCADKARPKIHGVGECLFEPVISTVEVKDSITAWITDGAVDFLETRDPTRPFFLWTSYTKPHPPFDPCRDFWEIYDGIPMPEPVYGDWSQNLEEAPQGFLAGTYENSNVYYYSKEQIAASRRAYYAMITQVDYSLGRLFGCLRENHLLENTWVVFTADHGEMLGDHYMAQKNMFFEGCAHVPLLIMPPLGRDLLRNIRVDTLAEIADVFPTILAMAGVDAPKEAKGKNLLELSEEREFYGASLDTHFCVMDGPMKLIYCACGGHTLLFDMEKDPMEQRDLSHDPAYAAKREELFGKLLAHTAQYRPEALENGQFKVTPAPRFPGDVKGRWYGFHYHDYSVDTFH